MLVFSADRFGLDYVVKVGCISGTWRLIRS